MKKLVSLALALSLALSLAACSGGAASSTPTEPSATVTVASLNGAKETVEVAVPYDPQRIAVLDMAALDILDALGVGDRVVGTADTSLDYLQGYIGGGIANLGTIKEADLEAVMACDPDVIFVVYMAYAGDDPDAVRAEQLAAIQDDPALASLSAVQNGRVHLIMLGDIYASGPRTIDGIRTLAQGMYPGLDL